ncbi:MAG: hypothetical protein IPP90_02785 [Gemmatimonadaceae bacterium]|nr:hypothetical protein [Gemmatimonadaceae bacterium]
MRTHATTCSCAAVLLALSMASAAPAAAQLGKLKKIGADAIKDAAGGKKPEPVKDPTAARVDYVITEARLASIIAVLTPLAVSAQKEADARAVSAGYEAGFKAATDCINKAASGSGVPDMEAMQSPRYQAIATKAKSVAPRLSAAQSAKRYREYVALADTSIVLQMQTASLMFKNSCPAVPYKPAAILALEAARWETMDQPSESSDELSVPADARGGMTTGQFGRIRERMALWTLIQAGTLPPTSEKFTDAENTALTARAADLKKFGPLFKAGTMQWVSWGDIKSW